MARCALCSKEIEVPKEILRKDTCPQCGGDLRICLNCKFHNPSSHNKCLEPKAEFQRFRDKATFCDYFTFGAKTSSLTKPTSAHSEAVKKQFDDLFKK